MTTIPSRHGSRSSTIVRSGSSRSSDREPTSLMLKSVCGWRVRLKSNVCLAPVWAPIQQGPSLSACRLPASPALQCRGLDDPELGLFCRHGSNAGHSSGVAQGQRSLNRCSGGDFQHEVFAPTATAAFHSQTVAAGMLLQQRPTRRVLSCATAKLLRDEAESMVPNIDPEQVRKLAGWGLTRNDRASFVGWSPLPSAVGPVPHQPGFLIVL